MLQHDGEIYFQEHKHKKIEIKGERDTMIRGHLQGLSQQDSAGFASP